MLPNASFIEITQLLLALFGVGIGFWKLWVAIDNGLYATRDESTDLRLLVAETQILSELFRLFQQGCLVALGVISVLLPPPSPDVAQSQPEALQSFLLRVGLMTLTIVMVTDSTVQELRRRHFVRRVKEERDDNGARAVAVTIVDTHSKDKPKDK